MLSLLQYYRDFQSQADSSLYGRISGGLRVWISVGILNRTPGGITVKVPGEIYLRIPSGIRISERNPEWISRSTAAIIKAILKEKSRWIPRKVMVKSLQQSLDALHKEFVQEFLSLASE